MRRNDPCPCGSGIKFKRCCAPYKDSFGVFPLAGALDLGHGAYPEAELEATVDPLDPIFRLEARVHIAAYMESHHDSEGALTVLKENIALAETYKGGIFLKDAWQHYLLLCQNHTEFRKEGLRAINHLLSLVKTDREKGTLLCDKGDRLSGMGDLEAAKAEYAKLFMTFPNFSQGRLRYASMLFKQERKQDAKKVLTDLLSETHIDRETRWDAIALLDDLGVDVDEYMAQDLVDDLDEDLEENLDEDLKEKLDGELDDER
ncbi:SEC-C domain-containing protein [Acididesulfobacillus acetoxydans]|uniref:SEC-C domain-containing protein n=1 Tax=Acididesulfobacillus acetoxydans TaxID=1561005 RepID=UPI001F0E7733|nr:SEC-C domain-containing protein [Acididesulfobacillus acetoxydans]